MDVSKTLDQNHRYLRPHQRRRHQYRTINAATTNTAFTNPHSLVSLSNLHFNPFRSSVFSSSRSPSRGVFQSTSSSSMSVHEEALEHANEEQKKVLHEKYEKKDPTSVAKVKELYNTLNLQNVFEDYESKSYKCVCVIFSSDSMVYHHELKACSKTYQLEFMDPAKQGVAMAVMGGKHKYRT
ncbi:hypothetical protein L2E82_25853 [Cichorium intybus]|uniref:Uncharacterized protein n=1 Tax=Cichorium intybus TaxID=13427 RepID=A0ACB9E483_CICIN|nr:hypothetical protein L2E82_25853 [Cichorium intybus]